MRTSGLVILLAVQFRNIFKWKIRDNPDATEEPYYPANNADCANYVSQAIHAGGIDKTSNDVNDKYHWFASEYGALLRGKTARACIFILLITIIGQRPTMPIAMQAGSSS